MRPGRARVTRQKSRERGESRRAFRDGIRREVGLEQTMSDVLFWVVLQLRVRRRASRVSRVLHFGVWTLGLGQSSACPGPLCVSCPTHPQRDAAPLRGDDHPRAHEASADHGDDVIWLRGYECAAVWFGGGSSEPPHGLYGPKTPIAIPTSHRSVTSLALTEIGWRGTRLPP
jgi:hypothetical protein